MVWHAPENTGDDTTDYDVEYKKTTELPLPMAHTGTATTTATITGLDADTSYQVRVRATNGEARLGTGPWSLVGTGSTNKEGQQPCPRSGYEAVDMTGRVDENTSPRDRVVGSPVSATDAITCSR